MYGKTILKNTPVLFALALIENAYDETGRIIALKKEEIENKEPLLLDEAKALMGRIYFSPIDLLIVDKIGKDISGEGMDANFTGRFATKYASGGIDVRTLAVLDLTDASHGSILGLGMADVTTMRVINKADFEISYANTLTSTIFLPSKIPLVFQSDKQAIAACLRYCAGNDPQNPKVVRISDTMHLEQIWVSEALLKEAEINPWVEILSEPQEFSFDPYGNLW